MNLKLKIPTKWTLKMLKLGMASSFHPHSMCERVERVTAKTGRTLCLNWTNSFRVKGFRTRTHLLHRQFKILITYYNSGLFLRSAGAIQSHVINFQPFLTSFAIFNALTYLFWAKWPWNWKTLQNELWKGWKLAWYHHFTHVLCA